VATAAAAAIVMIVRCRL